MKMRSASLDDLQDEIELVLADRPVRLWIARRIYRLHRWWDLRTLRGCAR